MSCNRPLTWAQIVDYVVNDADGAADGAADDAVEGHLMSCAWCTAEAEAAMRIAFALRGTLPPCVSAAQVEALRARGLVIADNTFAPGTRTQVVFARGVDLLIHHLAGLDLARADRVEVTVRVESTGDVIVEDFFAPFDPQRGEVLIACQRHFAALPPDIKIEVQVHTPAAPLVLATYRIPHVFT